MKKGFLSASLLAALALGAAQAQAGTPVMVQPPQSQVAQSQAVQAQAGVTFTLMYPLLAVPESTPVPSQVRYSMSRPADRLEVSGAPTGMVVRLTQDSVTIETRKATPGQYPLRITGYWGNERHSVELLVAVYATDGQGQVPAIVNTQDTGTATTVTVPTPTPATTPVTPVTPVPTPPAAPGTNPVAPVTSTTSTTTVTPIPTPVPVPVVTTPTPVPAPVNPAPVSPMPVSPAPVTIPTPAAQGTVTVPPQDVPQASTTATPAASESRNPFRAILPRLNGQGGRPATEGFTAWGGLGSGFNVGVSVPLGQVQAFNAAVRGSAELLPTGGLGTPALGADLLLHRAGSNLYFGPSTAVAFGSGNGLALGGLVGFAGNLNTSFGYYLEGRARFGRLGGQTRLSPGLRLGVTYQLGR